MARNMVIQKINDIEIVLKQGKHARLLQQNDTGYTFVYYRRHHDRQYCYESISLINLSHEIQKGSKALLSGLNELYTFKKASCEGLNGKQLINN